jgi:DnaK suppressor protein
VPDDDAPDDAVPDGDLPDGDKPDGDLPDGDGPDGDLPDGDGPDGPRVAEELARARAEAVERLAGLTGGFDELVAASRDSNADDEHDPEGATIAFERSQLDSLVVRARAQVAELDAAARRLAEGRYGRCETCDEPIPPARLAVLPAARSCVECAGRRPRTR